MKTYKQYNNLNEDNKLKTIKFSELSNWDIKSMNIKNTIIKNELKDKTLAYKTMKLWEKYNLGIFDIVKKDFLSPNYKLPNENLIEYRIILGETSNINWFKNMYDVDSLKDYIKKYGNDDRDIEDVKLDWEKIKNKTINEIRGNSLTFSVFFDGIIPNFNEEVTLAVWYKAAMYMKMIKNSYNTTKEALNYYEALTDNPEDFTKFLNINNISITNNNIKDVLKYCYRLRKDSIFFDELKQFLGNDYNSLINEFFKLI